MPRKQPEPKPPVGSFDRLPGALAPRDVRALLRACKRASFRQIFNGGEGAADPESGDGMRSQAPVSSAHPSVRSAVAAVRAAGYMEGRTPGAAVLLRSRPGCAAQPLHTDYDVGAECAPRPGGLLVALTPEGKFGAQTSSGVADVALGAGDAVVFDADCVHRGCAYDRVNYRLHVYLDTERVSGQDLTYLVKGDLA